jgi:hypothetical protein
MEQFYDISNWKYGRIKVREGELGDGGMVYWNDAIDNGWQPVFQRLGVNAFTSREEAIKEVESRITKELNSLCNEISNLYKITRELNNV